MNHYTFIAFPVFKESPFSYSPVLFPTLVLLRWQSFDACLSDWSICIKIETLLLRSHVFKGTSHCIYTSIVNLKTHMIFSVKFYACFTSNTVSIHDNKQKSTKKCACSRSVNRTYDVLCLSHKCPTALRRQILQNRAVAARLRRAPYGRRSFFLTHRTMPRELKSFKASCDVSATNSISYGRCTAAVRWRYSRRRFILANNIKGPYGCRTVAVRFWYDNLNITRRPYSVVTGMLAARLFLQTIRASYGVRTAAVRAMQDNPRKMARGPYDMWLLQAFAIDPYDVSNFQKSAVGMKIRTSAVAFVTVASRIIDGMSL